MDRYPLFPVAPLILRFHYDALDRQIDASDAKGSNGRRFYHQDRVRNEVHPVNAMTHIHAQGLSLASLHGGGPVQATLSAEDAKGTPLFRNISSDRLQAVRETLAYLPYGDTVRLPDRLPGYNGELGDPVTGWYLLGNGQRVYNPRLQRFHNPDLFSPFDEGGLNPYTFCVGDPINYADPTGQTPWWMWAATGVGMVLSSVATVLTAGAAAPLLAGSITASAGLAAAATVAGAVGIAAGVTSAVLSETDPQNPVGPALGWTSLGLGIAAAGLSGLSGAAARAASGSLGKMPIVASIGDAQIENFDEALLMTAHGAPYATGADGIISGGKLASRLSVIPEIRNAPPEKVLKLVSCYSANGGKFGSQAQRVANKLGRNVVGYYGPVGDTAIPSVNPTGFFTPQTGLPALSTKLLNGGLSRVTRVRLAARRGYRSAFDNLYGFVR
jgi:RHS repeat-associated protein